ncbi:hypothetical protein CMV_026119 [Castanea mollissima]|uniref:Uncharacterized protein n=1 Tax=Castanea mollissima TaxID=60419 RepID=A0A8J4QI02_9ROSI|nr:hypothetical protein CMV_026119 [Castanea mollissima]
MLCWNLVPFCPECRLDATSTSNIQMLIKRRILVRRLLYLYLPLAIGVSNPVSFPSMLGPLIILEPTHMSFK